MGHMQPVGHGLPTPGLVKMFLKYGYRSKYSVNNFYIIFASAFHLLLPLGCYFVKSFKKLMKIQKKKVMLIFFNLKNKPNTFIKIVYMKLNFLKGKF